MVAAPRSFAAPLKRSNVLWTLKSLAIDMMMMAILHPLSFKVRYRSHDLYLGSWVIAEPRLSVLDQTPSHPLSLSIPTLRNSTDVTLKSAGSTKDQPNYQINFNFVGAALSKIRIFESILTLLLRLAKNDSWTVIPRACMELPQIRARLFILQVARPPRAYRFQQYHAVALLEAVASAQYGLLKKTRTKEQALIFTHTSTFVFESSHSSPSASSQQS
ncbi:MAG: hypothetical protein Q9169_004834 [Polycauliona sp. 2 TL-2023]